jgi:hypothetical protein
MYTSTFWWDLPSFMLAFMLAGVRTIRDPMGVTSMASLYRARPALAKAYVVSGTKPT